MALKEVSKEQWIDRECFRLSVSNRSKYLKQIEESISPTDSTTVKKKGYANSKCLYICNRNLQISFFGPIFFEIPLPAKRVRLPV